MYLKCLAQFLCSINGNGYYSYFCSWKPKLTINKTLAPKDLKQETEISHATLLPHYFTSIQCRKQPWDEVRKEGNVLPNNGRMRGLWKSVNTFWLLSAQLIISSSFTSFHPPHIHSTLLWVSDPPGNLKCHRVPQRTGKKVNDISRFHLIPRWCHNYNVCLAWNHIFLEVQVNKQPLFKVRTPTTFKSWMIRSS